VLKLGSLNLIQVQLHFEAPAQFLPYCFAREATSEQVIIKPGDLFCIHWWGERPESSLESILKGFRFGFGRIGFFQFFANEPRI